MDIDSLLQRLNIQETGRSDEWIYCYCPFHGNTNTRSAEISLERGYFYCFACATYISLIDLAMRVLNITPYEALRLTYDFRPVKLEVDFEYTFSTLDEETIARLESNLFESLPAQEWLRNRGITNWEIYRAGYSKRNKMVVLPVDHPYKQNTYIGLTGRMIDQKVFKHSPGLPKKHTLYGIQHARTSPTVYLTESPFDAIMVTAAGKPTVASLGNISTQQIDLLSRWSTIVVLQDNDAAGNKTVETITKKLPKHIIKSIQWPNKQYKDVGESGVEYTFKYIQ